ncbi:tyrosine-type recombinase/integrase [Shimia sp. SDUM112013]|uniref:tyrosine-type recombinase/integrase n=1 Tax=Shimia sp. SDUM112013 TaxID=3136160 RepID=UPI0032ECA0E5
MSHLDQPRGEGTAYRFRMKTPRSLQGRHNPWTNKPFGTWIIRSMNGERHRPSAERLAKVYHADVIRLEAEYQAAERYSPERAKLWNEASRTDKDKELVRDLIYEEIQKAPKDKREAFSKAALASSPLLKEAVPDYIAARSEGNPYGYAPLAKSTIADLKAALGHLSRFLGVPLEEIYMGDLNRDNMLVFRGEHLPKQISKRTGEGLAPATIEKMMTVLRNLWHWAQEHRGLPTGVTPFDLPKGIRRERPQPKNKRRPFEPSETRKVLSNAPSGELLGDIFRVALVTGARASEVAKVKVGDTKDDGSVFFIGEGKTKNARRVVPVPEVAQPLIQRLRKAAKDAGEDRLFYMTPLAPQTGNASALSKRFTRFRREVLGAATDGQLDFHCLRHTWRTTARRAGLTIDDTHDLGGWASVGRTSNPYDHGLNLEQLAEAQERVASLLAIDGHLEGF